MKNAKAVALVINSPGGSHGAVAPDPLTDQQLAAEKKLPVLAFVEDVAASGGYMIACAGDEIFCDPSSIVGSIGVIGGTFGFQELIKRIGVERRLYTAGAHKGMLDPFLPENPDDVARIKAIQREIHALFIALVKQSRGTRLKGQRRCPVHREYWAERHQFRLAWRAQPGPAAIAWSGGQMARPNSRSESEFGPNCLLSSAEISRRSPVNPSQGSERSCAGRFAAQKADKQSGRSATPASYLVTVAPRSVSADADGVRQAKRN